MAECTEDHASDRVRASDDLALADCFVSLVAPPTADGPWPPNARYGSVTFRRGRLVPHASWVRVGTNLVVVNAEACDLYLHGYRDSLATTQFNFALPANGVVFDFTGTYLDRRATILLRCDGYVGLDGVVHVVDHPWHDLTSIDRAAGKAPGEYVLAEVPPGEHRLTCRHLGLRWQEVRAQGRVTAHRYDPEIRLEATVVVRAGETAVVDFPIPSQSPK
jgi:hypothetical protein